MPRHTASLSGAVLSRLAGFGARRFFVACSGGLDSTVLMHVLSTLRAQLAPALIEALHVDHALQSRSAQWAAACQARCEALGVRCTVLHVRVRPARGESPEDAARRARYVAIASRLVRGDVLLTAHHRDDQAETLLLQLLRGAGVNGLSAMPVCAALGEGMLLRPLLDFDRADLRDYADANRLDWIEDHSNADTRFDRNYLRHEVLPRLRTRWPSLSRTLARSARHCADAASIIADQSGSDVRKMCDAADGSLSIVGLKGLPLARQRQALRAWIGQRGLPMPDEDQLAHILRDVVDARSDASPMLRWPGVELRRHNGRLYVSVPLRAHDATRIHPWVPDEPLVIPGIGVLSAQCTTENGLAPWALRQAPVTVRFRRGGERLRPAGRGHTHALKHLMQEAHIPPWRRDRVPIVYCGETIAAVTGLCVCEGFQAASGSPGLKLILETEDR